MLAGHCVADSGEFIAGKFDQAMARRAVEVVVLRIAVIVFVDGSSTEHHFFEQASFNHFSQRAVNSRPTGPRSFRRAAEFS